MTETICSGWEWNPLSNSEVRVKKQDVYHSYPVKGQAGVINEPYAGTYQIKEVGQVQTVQVVQGE